MGAFDPGPHPYEQAMSKPRDFGIAWVVLFAALFWGAIWKHEPIVYWARKIWVSLPFPH